MIIKLSLNNDKIFFRKNHYIIRKDLYIAAIAFLNILCGCAANLQTVVYTDAVAKLQSEYIIDDCSTYEFNEKTSPDSISKENYIDIQKVNFMTMDGFNSKNNKYIGCLKNKLVTDNGHTIYLATKILKHATYYQYKQGTDNDPGGMRPTRYVEVPDPYGSKRWKQTGPHSGEWITGTKMEMKYERVSPSSKNYFQSVIGVDIDTLEYNTNLSRIGFFFNQITTGEEALFVDDIIRNKGYEGVYGDIKVSQNVTILNALHYGVPFIASVIPIIQIESGEWGRGTKPNPLMYIPIAILSYIATNWVLNIFIPDEASTTIEMTMARIKE